MDKFTWLLVTGLLLPLPGEQSLAQECGGCVDVYWSAISSWEHYFSPEAPPLMHTCEGTDGGVCHGDMKTGSCWSNHNECVREMADADALIAAASEHNVRRLQALLTRYAASVRWDATLQAIAVLDCTGKIRDLIPVESPLAAKAVAQTP